jgi:cell division protein FtsZ
MVAPAAPSAAPVAAGVFGGTQLTRDVFVARAPVEPRAPERMQPEFRMEPAAEVRAPVAEPAPVAQSPIAQKPDVARVSLFGRYRSLTSRKPDELAPKAPEPQTKIEKAGTLNIAVGPQDRPLTSHDEDELEIPAFLRRQAN